MAAEKKWLRDHWESPARGLCQLIMKPSQTFELYQDGMSFLVEIEFPIPEGFQSEAV